MYQCCDTTYFSFKIPRSAAISEADKIDACFTRCCMITAPGAHQLLHHCFTSCFTSCFASCFTRSRCTSASMPSLVCSLLLYDTT